MYTSLVSSGIEIQFISRSFLQTEKKLLYIWRFIVSKCFFVPLRMQTYAKIDSITHLLLFPKDVKLLLSNGTELTEPNFLFTRDNFLPSEIRTIWSTLESIWERGYVLTNETRRKEIIKQYIFD